GVSEKDYIRLQKYKLEKDDIVFSRVGSVDRRALVSDEEDGWLFSGRCLRVRVIDKDDVNPKYLSYLFGTYEFKEYIKSIAVGATMPSINTKILSDIEISIPKMEDQNRIVEMLYSIDSKVWNNKEIIENLEQLSQTLFKHWFIDFEFPNEQGEPYKSSGGEMLESDVGEIPKEFIVKKANEVFDINIGKTPSRKDTGMFSLKNGMTWVSIADLKEQKPFVLNSKEYLVPEAIDKYNIKMAKKNTVLLSFKLTVGRVALASSEMTTNEAIAHFNQVENGISPEYTYLYLKSFNYESLGNTSSIAKAVNSKIIKNMPFLIPNGKVLNDFELTIKPLFKQIKEIQLENQRLSDLRDILTPQLLSGKIEIPDELGVR
ncbi:restriction endonuclease subunit S, partial [Priestia megaterium]|uniref:restriction endonuclease subunit S n=2 Tax=Bacillaceae TaxID=186817 RepID=UPI002FFD7B43